MSFEHKDSNSTLDEIMAKINEIQLETQAEESTKRLIKEHDKALSEEEPPFPIDEALFDMIKEERTIPEEPIKEKSVIRRLLDGEEDDNEAHEELPVRSADYEEEPEDIEDFETEADRDEIYRDLKNTVGKMAVKMIALFFISLVSIYLFIAGFNPILFGGNIDTAWYDAAFLTVDLLCIFISFGIFSQGLGRLLRLRADTDTLLALLSISLVLVRIIALIKPDLFAYDLNFEPMLTIGLFYNVVAKKKIATNIKKNFKFISAPGDKLTVSMPPSCEVNNDVILETGEGGEILYAHSTGFVSKFIEHSYSDYDWDLKLQRIFFAVLFGVVAGTIAISQLTGWGEALLFPAAALSISTPFFSRNFYATSMAKIGKKNRKNGGILTSANSAEQLSETDLVVITEEEFLGNESVLLQGVKAMGNIQIDDLITYIAALFDKVGTPLKPLFLKMIDGNSISLPRVDDDEYYWGMGYSCLIESGEFLVGNDRLMEKLGVEFPEALKELKLKDCRFPVYVAYKKKPAGIFIVSYERNKHTAAAIRLVEDGQLDIGIVSNDFLFDHDLLKNLYSVTQPELFHFLSSKTGKSCRPFLNRIQKSPDLIGSVTGLRGLLACLNGAKKMRTALKINTIIRVLYPILALALIFFIALAGYSANTALQILAFQAIWLLPIVFVCTFCK